MQTLCNCLKQPSSHLLDSLLQEVCIIESVVLKTQRFRCYCHLRYGVCVVYVLILSNKGLLVYFCLYLSSCSIEPQNSKRALTHLQPPQIVGRPSPWPSGCSIGAPVNIIIITASFMLQGFRPCEVMQH